MLAAVLAGAQDSQPDAAAPLADDQGEGTEAVLTPEQAYAAGFTAGLESASYDERFVEHFSSREPFYFVFGTRGTVNARVQLSFQYDFVAHDSSPAEHESFWTGIAVAYTQLSIWDLQADSVPFSDTNYRPSLFWYREAVLGPADGERLDIEFGYEHESNGRGGPDSRSINALYVRPTYHLPLDERWEFRTTPKVYAYIGDLSDNPDIKDYRGWFDWRLQLVDEQGFGFSTNLRKGGESSFGSIQVDVTYPINRLFGENLDLFLHLQYFNGWGETMLFYDVKQPAQLRVGISLVR